MKSKNDILTQINTAKEQALNSLRNQYTKDDKLITKEDEVIVTPEAYLSALEGEFDTLTASVNKYFADTKTLNFKALYSLMLSVTKELSREYKDGTHLRDYLSYDTNVHLYDFEDFTFTAQSVFSSITYEIEEKKSESSSSSAGGKSGSSSSQSSTKTKKYKSSLLSALNSVLNTRHAQDSAKITAKINQLSNKDEHFDLACSGTLGFIVSEKTDDEAHQELYDLYFKDYKEKREIIVPLLEGYLKKITAPVVENTNISIADILKQFVLRVSDTDNSRVITLLDSSTITLKRVQMNGFSSIVFSSKTGEDTYNNLKYDLRNVELSNISDFTDVDPSILNHKLTEKLKEF